MVAALERAWAGIARRHPEVPGRVAFALGSGTAGRVGSWRKGHYAAGRWQDRSDATVAHEVFVAGELLGHDARDVLATLLHEAGHALAHERKLQDTSRGGRYHNTRFRALAAELGLEVARDNSIGWSLTTLPDATAARYRRELTALTAALTTARRAEPSGHGRRTNNNNGLALVCGCGRRVRASATVVEQGPIVCGLCLRAFIP